MSRERFLTPPPSPLPPSLAKRDFPGEGGGGVYFEGPRGRNFIPPPFIHAPPLGGQFQGWGGGGLDGPIRANRFADSRESLDLRESFQGSQSEPLFCESRLGPLRTFPEGPKIKKIRDFDWD